MSVNLRGLFMLLTACMGWAQTTWYVDDDACPGPGSGTQQDPFCSIQVAINAAVDLDAIEVAAGSYSESLDFIGKNVIVVGIAGAGVTSIDGGLVGDVVTFANGESPTARIEGFTITNGLRGVVCDGSSHPTIEGNVIMGNMGAGVVCANSSHPTINSNEIVGNTSPSSGGGIVCGNGSHPLIQNNLISGNTSLLDWAWAGGGGIWLSASSPTIRGNNITDNTAVSVGGGIYCYFGSAPLIEWNLIANNSATSGLTGRGGGIACRLAGSTPTIKNNTIHGNSAAVMAGGVLNEVSSTPVINCILWGNFPSQIDGGSSASVSYSDVQGGWFGTGNINADPFFVDAPGGDFRLQDGSPCIDAGDPNSDPDCDGSSVDIGAISAALCGPFWLQSPVNNNWYISTDGVVTWADAEAQAQSWGGHLATVRSQAENDWLLANFASDGHLYWIGYHDSVVEGQFEWASEETPGYENWRAGEPDDLNGADWAAISPVTGTWLDETFLPERPGIVEVISDDCDGDGLPDAYQIALEPWLDWNGDGVLDYCATSNYCSTNPNSSGVVAVIGASGSPVVAESTFTLEAWDLPLNEFGYFLASESPAFVPNFGGSDGNLCIGAPQYRFNNPIDGGQVLNSGSTGTMSFTLDLDLLPQGIKFDPGETWYFQLWFRDFTTGPTSNTTDGSEVLFR